MLSFIKDTIKNLIETNAARFIAYSTALAVGAVAALDNAIEAVELSPEFMVGLAAFVTVLATEAVRLAVWSIESHKQKVEEAVVAGFETGVVAAEAGVASSEILEEEAP